MKLPTLKRAWTVKELEYLKQNAHKSTKECASQLSRSLTSVYPKRSFLNQLCYKSSDSWIVKEENLIAKKIMMLPDLKKVPWTEIGLDIARTPADVSNRWVNHIKPKLDRIKLTKELKEKLNHHLTIDSNIETIAKETKLSELAILYFKHHRKLISI